MYQPHQNSNGFEGFGAESSDLGDILTAECYMDQETEDYSDIFRPFLVGVDVAQIDSMQIELDRHKAPPASYFPEIQNPIPLVTSTAVAQCGEARTWTIRMPLYHSLTYPKCIRRDIQINM